MFPILQLGPLAIQMPGLFIIAGVWVATWLVEKEVPKYRLSGSHLSNLILIGLAVGIIGARLGYALRYLEIYLDDPQGLIALNPSTLAPLEGYVSGLLAAWIYAQKVELPLWPTLEALTPGFAIFAVAYSFSHLSSGDAFGAATSAPWAIQLWGEYRHPSQIYEIIGASLVFLLIWRLRTNAPFEGFLVLSWVTLSAAMRLFLESFRGDSVVVFGSLRSAQLVSLGLMAAALAGLHLLARQRVTKPASQPR